MDNAERQKRYRDRKRNAPVTENVTRSPNTVTGDSCNVTRGCQELDAALVSIMEKTIELADDRIGPDVYYWPRNVPNTYDEWLRKYQPIPGDWDYVGCVDDTVTPARLRVA